MELDVVCGLFANVAACTASNMATVHKTSVPTPSVTRTLKWFSTTIAEVTQNSANIPYAPFPKRLRDAIEPHIQKCRAKRASMLDAIRLASGQERYDQILKEFNECNLSCESMFKFDYDKHQLREHFVRACGLPPETDLRQIHRVGEGTKDRMLRSLVQNYENFQIIYDIFVRDVCVPIFAAAAGKLCNEVYYQSFPCIRVVRPGDFSIGPHADLQYGHTPVTVNFYAPLTTIGGSNALFLESEVGAENWRPIEGDYGQVKRFAGGYCAHWTAENKTPTTRVSLDFRLIDGEMYGSLASARGDLDKYRKLSGYYTLAKRHAGRWERVGSMSKPDARMGFPFTNSEWVRQTD